ncbi:Uncharacterised protein [Corynebacterium kutscheri]|uniref:SIR2-like domain n=1 Tax=Corynebacterium kutscheri TaxID=35755 RepID=A0AB38VQV7_9CORY|nr:Uncharacterised protein [Corynebacterium kutscheri]VEH81953.1 Uncharacterised protein [Corynebacterium kutscheri]
MNESLPKMFLWHKAGSESSLNLTSTLNVKELQRINNPDRIFLWGLGSSVSDTRLQHFLDEVEEDPQVVISQIISKPRPQDVQFINEELKTIRVWNSATEILTGENFPFPEGSQVVSTAFSKKGEPVTRSYHYALVCKSDTPINTPLSERPVNELLLDPAKIKNFDSEKPTNGSMTLFAVAQGKPNKKPISDKLHRVHLKLRLVEPYLVKLGSPQLLKQVRISNQTGQYPV